MTSKTFSNSGVGGDLRALRKSRNLTLDHVAGKLEKSVGWLSQVERGISQPNTADIQALAALYNVPVSILFASTGQPEAEQGRVVRASERRRIGHRATGLVEELLSPDLTDSFEVIHSTFEPRSGLVTAKQRPTEEIGYILSGRLVIYMGDDRFELKRGDSFRIRNEPYRWENPYNMPAVALWVIAPPVY